jgi:signal transduction histidine kinase
LQIMANLISNAAKFSFTNGSIEINIFLKSRDQVRLEVVDHGKGIPESFYAYIFNRFSQADLSSTRSNTGTGLGLSICKAIIEKLGGSIGFTSKVGTGSVFYFDLPVLTDLEMQ